MADNLRARCCWPMRTAVRAMLSQHYVNVAALQVAARSRRTGPGSKPRQRDPDLRLVLALLVLVGHRALLVGLEEDQLGDALVGVDARREGRRVRDLEGGEALPLGLERGHVRDDAAARVRRLADADGEHVARDA